MDLALRLIEAIWRVTGEMAPYLLLGFVLAGLLSVLIAPAAVRRHLGAPGLRQVAKAALIGVPLPLCSCGVLPLAATLRRQGASPGATLSFAISTPQTGVDSILATQALMGPVFAVVRVLTAFISGILGGALLEGWARRSPGPNGAPVPDAPPETTTAASRTWREGLRYGLVVLPRAIGRALLLGLVLSGLLTVLIPPAFFAGTWGAGALGLPLMLVVGLPLYVCSTGSIPIAYAFIHMGLSPGAAFVFLVSGPATSAAALIMMYRILGWRGALVCLGTVAFTALAGGLLLDRWLPVEMVHAHAHTHGASPGLGSTLAAVILLAMLLPSLRPRKPAAPRITG